MTWSTSAAAVCCSRASSSSRRSRTTSVSWPALEEPRLCTVLTLRIPAFCRRALASLPLALERRRIAQGRDYADVQSEITAGICDRRNGVPGQFARQQSLAAHVRFGSKADISPGLSHVRL